MFINTVLLNIFCCIYWYITVVVSMVFQCLAFLSSATYYSSYTSYLTSGRIIRKNNALMKNFIVLNTRINYFPDRIKLVGVLQFSNKTNFASIYTSILSGKFIHETYLIFSQVF